MWMLMDLEIFSLNQSMWDSFFFILDADVPHFDRRSRIFELDPCDGYGKLCMVYLNTKPGTESSV